MVVRNVNRGDLNKVRGLYMSAFPVEERGVVSQLALDLFETKSTPSTISLLAELDGFAVGHVAFSPVSIEGIEEYQAYILAPLAVQPDFQKQGVGSTLVNQGIHQLSSSGVDMLFVYGDPGYYGRFGFVAESAERFLPPCPLKYAFGWLGMKLGKGDLPAAPVKFKCVKALNDPALW